MTQRPTVFVKGISGLANNIFQVLAAIYYAEKFNAKILIDKRNKNLKWGTSRMFGRYTCRENNGVPVPYHDSIFRKLQKTSVISNNLTIHNDFSGNKLDLKPTDAALIGGYCQNKDLFIDYKDAIFKYLNLFDPTILNYLAVKYPMNPNFKNIMVGLRIGKDFSHMKKLTRNSYTKALDLIIGENVANVNGMSNGSKDGLKQGEDYHIYVLSDVRKDWEHMIDPKYMTKTTLVSEDDITQIHLGMMCNCFVLSESTYHYIIALFACIKDPTKKVIVFNNTDITNRNLPLDSWTKIDY